MDQKLARRGPFLTLPRVRRRWLGPTCAATGAAPSLSVESLPRALGDLSRRESASTAHVGPIIEQFRQLAAANENLRQELARWHERLGAVLESAENFSSFENPGEVRAALLKRYAAELGAAVVLLDDGGSLVFVEPGDATSQSAAITPDRIRTCLGPEIEAVRRSRRACCLNGPQAGARGLDDGHVLLGVLPESTRQPSVVVALRGGHQPSFDDSDRLAAEALLSHGGHRLGNARMVQRLQQASLETVAALANALEARDDYTRGHSERVGWLATLTGKVLRLPESELQSLEWAGLLHDVGKIGIPEHILSKPSDLTPAEFEQVKQHPRLGYEVLRPVSSLQPVLDAVLYHHENHDGSGYPEGLRGEQVPLFARILHAVDIFDALTSTRSYRARLDMDEALEVLNDGAGSVTAPAVTQAFVSAFREYRRAQPEDCRGRFGPL